MLGKSQARLVTYILVKEKILFYEQIFRLKEIHDTYYTW